MDQLYVAGSTDANRVCETRMLMSRLILIFCGYLANAWLASQCLAAPMSTVAPVSEGSYAVSCSNVAQDFSLAQSNDVRAQYWEGVDGHYVASLLSEPESAFLFSLPVPNEAGLYANHAGQQITYVALVCFPTSKGNFALDFPVSTDGLRVVPKMLRKGESPLWFDPSALYPIILFSHGLGGSPLGEGYLDIIVKLASYGYVVAAPFHGDPRFSEVKHDGLKDMVNLFFRGGTKELTEMQALRPLSLRMMLDLILAHQDYHDHVDVNKIVGFGASLGAESLLLFAGAELTTDFIPKLRSSRVMRDPRLKAAVGYAPYFGQRLLPAFGDDQNGLNGLSMPFLAISGTADTTAPMTLTEQGVNLLTGSRYLVAIDGLEHELRQGDISDIFTWALAFYDAYPDGSPSERAKMGRMEEVAGGAKDSSRIDYTAPSGMISPTVIEYYNTILDHYFLTADQGEMGKINSGMAGPGWLTSGYAFGSSGVAGSPLCRFYGNAALNESEVRIGPNSHFYTLAGAECEWVKQDPGWVYEGLGFNMFASALEGCAMDQLPVYRDYNNDFAHNNSNHRYTTSRQVYRAMQAHGWVGEGIVFCASP